jgi:hypothetical protein
MDELITTIYEITVDLNRVLKEENYQEFEKLLNTRNAMMIRVDNLKAEHPHYQYSPKVKRLLEDTLYIDLCLTPLLKKNITETRNLLNQIKRNKKVSKKYYPYIKQTNGVFLDSRK